jgi:hypothetical protein
MSSLGIERSLSSAASPVTKRSAWPRSFAQHERIACVDPGVAWLGLLDDLNGLAREKLVISPLERAAT